MSDEPVAPCPGCGRAGRRLISGGAGLLFRGDGFYITDHRSESYRERAREEAGGGAGDGKKEQAGGKRERAAEKKEASATASGEQAERATPGAAEC